MLQRNVRGEELMRVFETIVHGNEQDLMQENANVDGRSPMGVMGTFASESAKYYAVENLLSDQVKKAINENILYPHDLDFLCDWNDDLFANSVSANACERFSYRTWTYETTTRH